MKQVSGGSVHSHKDRANLPSLYLFSDRPAPKAQGRNVFFLTFYNATLSRDSLGVYFKAMFSFCHLAEVSYLHILNTLAGNSRVWYCCNMSSYITDCHYHKLNSKLTPWTFSVICFSKYYNQCHCESSISAHPHLRAAGCTCKPEGVVGLDLQLQLW